MLTVLYLSLQGLAWGIFILAILIFLDLPDKNLENYKTWLRVITYGGFSFSVPILIFTSRWEKVRQTEKESEFLLRSFERLLKVFGCAMVLASIVLFSRLLFWFGVASLFVGFAALLLSWNLRKVRRIIPD